MSPNTIYAFKNRLINIADCCQIRTLSRGVWRDPWAHSWFQYILVQLSDVHHFSQHWHEILDRNNLAGLGSGSRLQRVEHIIEGRGSVVTTCTHEQVINWRSQVMCHLTCLWRYSLSWHRQGRTSCRRVLPLNVRLGEGGSTLEETGLLWPQVRAQRRRSRQICDQVMERPREGWHSLRRGQCSYV